MKSIDVVALGELLIDFAQKENHTFAANPGGAPCNVLAMLKQAGKETAFIGKVGNDLFGKQLKEVLDQIGIRSDGLVFDDAVRTTLAFVANDASGERTFSFYRNPGADMMLCEQEVRYDLIEKAKIFHFGTLSMTHETPRQATMQAIAYAKQNHTLISFDPNLRPALWSSLDDAKAQMKAGCAVCDVIKIEAEELRFLSNQETIEAGVQYLQELFAIPLILVTCGNKGAHAFGNGYHVWKDAFLNPNTCDTTGAGDTFCAVCLAYLCDTSLSALDEKRLSDMLLHANAAASIVTTRIGALTQMPSMKEVEAYIKQNS